MIAFACCLFFDTKWTLHEKRMDALHKLNLNIPIVSIPSVESWPQCKDYYHWSLSFDTRDLSLSMIERLEDVNTIVRLIDANTLLALASGWCQGLQSFYLNELFVLFQQPGVLPFCLFKVYLLLQINCSYARPSQKVENKWVTSMGQVSRILYELTIRSLAMWKVDKHKLSTS